MEFASLPYELQEMIPLYLTPHDLAVCALVNQAWYTLFHPHIWRHLDNLPRRGFGYWKYISSGYCGWEGLANNAHLVQSLTIHFDSEDQFYLDCNQEERSAHGWKELKLEMLDEQDGEDEDGYVRRSIVHGEKMVKAILAQASTLEVLKLDGAGYFTSKDINHLLCSAPNLRVLQLLKDRRAWAGQEPFLDAKDAAQSEWVCRNLEIFGCGIGGIPRPDITQKDDDEPARKDSPLRQFDCLAMTLDSGLDQLKGLRNLRTVELKDMEVHIGKPLEQKWVADNWPKVGKVSFT
ncbi:hypothetical protein BGZ95_001268 [Linnemannia exigua]|uniref:F-box domain-containing protein n=1 Tax=Linnemannia exigua TaxID=604196 RepID=A0AAD4D7G7_9FUNG|nr:hypothetical protein BGZ95_001268 [Linnemannia exigua]